MLSQWVRLSARTAVNAMCRLKTTAFFVSIFVCVWVCLGDTSVLLTHVREICATSVLLAHMNYFVCILCVVQIHLRRCTSARTAVKVTCRWKTTLFFVSMCVRERGGEWVWVCESVRVCGREKEWVWVCLVPCFCCFWRISYFMCIFCIVQMHPRKMTTFSRQLPRRGGFIVSLSVHAIWYVYVYVYL